MILTGPSRLKLLGRLILILLVGQPTRIWAQLSTAAVAGLIQDASRANIPNATVKLINTQTGSENSTSTGRDGSFVLEGVIPGIYTLQIERQGFATAQVSGIALSVGDLRNILVRLQVGRVAESVTVDASGMTLDTTDATVSTLVDRKLAEVVPLNGDNFQDLIALTPGIVTQSPQAAIGRVQTQGEFSVNGQPTETNAFYVDGISADSNSGAPTNPARTVGTGSAAGATGLGTTQSLVPVEALQQFRVLTSSYSAEYGRSPGGQFTFLTRSGTNTAHGAIFYNFRSNVFDAIDWFAQHVPYGNTFTGGTRFSQNDFGGSLGAPLSLPRLYQGRDRTFLFAAYEGLYVPQPTPQSYYYGVAPQFPYDPYIYTPLLQFVPTANDSEGLPATDGQPSGLGQVSMSPYALPAHLNSGTFRIDHTISPRLALFFRFGDAPSVSETQQLNTSSDNRLSNQTFSLGATGQIWSHLSNELRLGFVSTSNRTISTTKEAFALEDTPPLYTLAQALGIPANEKSVSSDAYFRVSGVGDSEAYTDVASGSSLQWNLRDTFLYEHGRHIFKFGSDQRHISITQRPPALTVQADFFSGIAILNNSVSGLVITRANAAHPIQEQFALFGQDDWKVAGNLTLSLGLRWELDPPPHGKSGQNAFNVTGQVATPESLRVAPRDTSLWHTPLFTVAPRMGLAWTIDNSPGKELILRSGAGVFVDGSNRAALPAFGALGFANSSHYADVPLPVTPSQLDVPSPGTSSYAGANGFSFPAHLQLPYSWQWNVALERAFGRDQTLTASYVGSSGRRLQQEQRINVTATNPSFGDITFFPGGISSNYQSMQIKFQRNIAHGLQTLASYTWAHLLDWGSTDPVFTLAHGNSDLDVRHNLEVAGSWDLPSPTTGWIIRNVFGGWRLDVRVLARTGFPITVEGNTFLDPVTGEVYFSGVDLVHGRSLYKYGNDYPGHRIFNGGPNVSDPVFMLPQAHDPGNAPRNLLRGFAAFQGNVGVRRSFQLRDTLHLQFGMDMFNVTNHPNFGYIDPNLPDLLFGQSTKLLYQSFGNSGSLYQQGAPRSAQISVRLNF